MTYLRSLPSNLVVSLEFCSWKTKQNLFNFAYLYTSKFIRQGDHYSLVDWSLVNKINLKLLI